MLTGGGRSAVDILSLIDCSHSRLLLTGSLVPSLFVTHDSSRHGWSTTPSTAAAWGEPPYHRRRVPQILRSAARELRYLRRATSLLRRGLPLSSVPSNPSKQLHCGRSKHTVAGPRVVADLAGGQDLVCSCCLLQRQWCGNGRRCSRGRHSRLGLWDVTIKVGL